MTKKILMMDALQLRYVRRRRAASGACIETCHSIGFAGEDEIVFNDSKSQIYRTIHWTGEHWRRVEYVLVGDGNWQIPRPAHPDCLVVREPRDGEVFDSETALLWLAPGQCVELKGTLAARILDGKHGDVIGNLREYFEQRVFEACLDTLTGEFGHDVDGQMWEFLVGELARAVGEATLIGADEEIVDKIAEATHRRLLEFVDNQP